MSEEILAMSPVFLGIPRDDVKRMLDAGVVQKHPSGDVVIKEGEYNDSLYVVLEGALEVCLPDSDERFGKVGLASLGPGQCVGEYSFIDRHPTSASVVTRGDTTLFTVRNGNVRDPGNAKTYAEKVMIVEEGQVTPWHFHGAKMEDIINRGGGKLVIELCNSDEERNLLDTEVSVSVDGVRRTVEPRGRVVLSPGESIALTQELAHQFYGAEGRVLVGEVSSVNDDETDNYFIDPAGRFPEIEEDEEPLYLLCNEYPPSR